MFAHNGSGDSDVLKICKRVLHTEFNVIVLVESGGVVTITAYKATAQDRLPDQVINLSCVSVESQINRRFRDVY